MLAFGLTFKRNQLIGVLIGLLGAIILIFNGENSNDTENYFYSIFAIVASACYAINVNLIKKYLSDVKPLSITTGNFLVFLIPAIIILFCTDFDTRMYLPETQHAMIYIIILGVVGTGIANIIFFRLIQTSSPVFATSVTYLIPIVAIFWGILDNESLNLIQMFGAFVILIGVYLANRK